MRQFRHRMAVALTLTLALALGALPGSVQANAPSRVTVQPVTSYDRHGTPQIDSFFFQAGPGPLQVRMNLAQDVSFALTVQAMGGGPVLFDGLLSADRPVVTVELPAQGAYRLLVAPNEVPGGPSPTRRIEVTGPDLIMPVLAVPALEVTAMEPFATKNEPFELAVQIKSQQPAVSQVQVYLGSNLLHENLLGPDGAVRPAVIDPTKLNDGIHVLQVLARSPEPFSHGSLRRSFFVDRIDTFRDLPKSHWARTPVEFMAHLGILNGRGDGLFEPGQPVTRAEFAKMIAATLQLDTSGPMDQVFADVPAGHWAAPYIRVLAAEGWLKGEVEGSNVFFYPNRTITRAEAATVIGRVLEVADADIATLDPAVLTLPDLAQVPAWAKPSVLVLRQMGWISGFEDGTFRPQERLNRDQAAKILSRFLGLQ